MPELSQAEQDRELVERGRRGITRQIVQRIETLDLDDKQIRLYSNALCNFQKVDVARERMVSQERIAEQRIAAQERIADKRNATNLEIVRIHADASIERAKHRPNHPQRNEDDPEAPWGRHKDGHALTHEEFMASLNEAIRDIYGLPPIHPKSYLPDELRKMHERYPDDPGFWPRGRCPIHTDCPKDKNRARGPDRKNDPTAPPAADSLHPK